MLPTVHLMCGFIGFGKTTIAKNLEKEFDAIRFTHDEIMHAKYGRKPDDFERKYALVDEYIRQEAEKAVEHGKDVVMDYGFWSKEKRREYYVWAKTLTPNVLFHVVECSIETAKERTLKRTEEDSDALFIDGNIFDILQKSYEPFSSDEGYEFIVHKNEGE